MTRPQLRCAACMEKCTMREENFCGLPRSSGLSRVSSNCARVVVPVHELPATGVPRSDLASAWVSASAADYVSVCVDGEYKIAYSRD